MKELFILILLFYIYSFIGWIAEVIISFFQSHKFINRGFLIGPICPVYGAGGVLIFLILSKYSKDPLVFFLLSIILCAALEYFTSYIMEKIFKNRWWDYSDMKYNINGRICLEFLIPMGVGAVIVIYGVNPILIGLLSKFNLLVLKIVSLSLLGLTLIDLILSFNIIINLKNISSTIRVDSTELITKKVREILASKNILHRRLLNSFPDMKITNKLAQLKDKMLKDKEKLEKEKERIKNDNKKKKRRK